MAKISITLVIADTDADTSNVSVFVSADTGDTVTSLTEDYARVFWDVVRPLITGILVDVVISLRPDISTWTNNIVDELSDVEEKAVFFIRVCGDARPARLSLPTVRETIFENSGRGKMVDMLDADVQAFVFVLENAVADDGISATDSHGVDFCKVVFGEQSFGKR